MENMPDAGHLAAGSRLEGQGGALISGPVNEAAIGRRVPGSTATS
jgi:hypothetical protein